jgi:ribosomal protein S18 acetylase RimI-like enzyme
MSRAAVTLRPASTEDEAFMARVYASTREQELAAVPFSPEQKAAFLAQQFAAQSFHYAKHYADASWSVIVVDGRPAGRLIVRRGDAAIHVIDIALLPEYRGRGTGTRLLRDLMGEARAGGKRLGIHVEAENPAMTLYRRLGFRAVEEAGLYLRMEWDPAGGVPGGQAKIAS